MSDPPAPYVRVTRKGLLLSEAGDGMFALSRLLPLSLDRFHRRLGRALAAADRHGSGFYLGGFAARRALGGKLIVDVDPTILEKRLEHLFKQRGRAYSIRHKFLGAGDWTPLLRTIARSTTYREVVEIIAALFDYRATPSYHSGMERAAGPNPMRRNFAVLSSPARVEAYFRRTAEMCRSIHEHGMVRRGDYGWRLAGSDVVRLPWLELGELDIGVAIGPVGELYHFASGKHRTAAAQALKLPSIPVEVRMVHADWLARRMAETGLSAVDALVDGIRESRFIVR